MEAEEKDHVRTHILSTWNKLTRYLFHDLNKSHRAFVSNLLFPSYEFYAQEGFSSHFSQRSKCDGLWASFGLTTWYLTTFEFECLPMGKLWRQLAPPLPRSHHCVTHTIPFPMWFLWAWAGNLHLSYFWKAQSYELEVYLHLTITFPTFWCSREIIRGRKGYLVWFLFLYPWRLNKY